MKTKAVVELITDAVTDAVREVLPRLIAEAVEQRVADGIAPQVERLERAQVDARGQLEAHERTATDSLNKLRAVIDSATRDVAERLTANVAEQVARAVSGVPSLPGPCGPPGPPGRDATFTPPVHWQAETGYTRGAVVMHRNGLWFANQDTAAEPGSGVDGYSLMFDGHELAGYQHDARGFQVAVYRYASGKLREVETGERPFRYCGVFDHETNYYLNDCVTAAGSMWMHKAPESCGQRPGTDEGREAWQLAVKSGRDGRDGAPGPQGPKGDPGERGPPGETVTRAPKAKANGARI